MSVNVCPLGDILGCVTGTWDEREVAFKLMMAREKRPLFEQQLINDRAGEQRSEEDSGRTN